MPRLEFKNSSIKEIIRIVRSQIEWRSHIEVFAEFEKYNLSLFWGQAPVSELNPAIKNPSLADKTPFVRVQFQDPESFVPIDVPESLSELVQEIKEPLLVNAQPSEIEKKRKITTFVFESRFGERAGDKFVKWTVKDGREEEKPHRKLPSPPVNNSVL